MLSLKYMYITNSPSIASVAENAGVDWIFVDLETMGKAERQKNQDSVKSRHTLEDVRMIRGCLRIAELLVRVDPLHDDSEEQIDNVIDAGADIIMLPMWRTRDEVARFLQFVNGRCRTMLLLETSEADRCLDDVLTLQGIDMVHIGLNDLHLSYQKTFMFELLADGTVERLCAKLRTVGIPYGFGGIGRIGGGTLPAEHILGEHVRLGSQMVILSRSFCDVSKLDSSAALTDIFQSGIHALRERENAFRATDAAVLTQNHDTLCKEVTAIVEQINAREAKRKA